MTDATPTAGPEEAVRVLRDDHERLLTVVGQCATAVTAEWDGDSVTDRERVVPPFRRALDGSGALSRLPRALADAVTATGRPMAAPPVAAPPYVVVTGEGVVLRANLGDGRLVVLLRAFEVDRGGDGDGDSDGDGGDSEPHRYRRIDGVEIEAEIV
ncbi:hypothetical protein [Haloferax volcanii]|uniref:DUF7988 domain-containing protein n=3 Tax=Haloferax volcanii TaxID=2246 RepID=A0A384LA43_HALVD|nr:hypothetical protein [Haloferax volcanii]ADE04298.1 uncharacterized protein HVO_2898 [Haloferax volcanii DS2]ELY24510.1 hypothetical protein C498_17685 [Haloferax volcanii DS2]MBS8120712.1 hypothetical protein [Haloferax volcanii]MBS8125749.1 hypothetical protein [Haloferax volcanii]MBS8129533.1 hypothetical protein [Haloferax volcanii]